MAYQASIDRANPSCILFVIDQSGSMSDRMEEGTKAETVATILNRVLYDLIMRCTGGDGGVPRDYFDVGVIGYGHAGPTNGMGSALSGQVLNPLSAVYNNPVRVEDRVRKVSDGAGGLVEINSRFPVWFEPVASGGTPMVAALDLAGATLTDWCNHHMQSYPPTILHVTDGQSTDGDPEMISNQIKSLRTDDGNAIMMNIHVAPGGGATIAFPDSDDAISDPFAKLLFRMSSKLPEKMGEAATKEGYRVNPDSRCLMFNAKHEDIIRFFDIGTRELR